jgi:hypothetical protein
MIRVSSNGTDQALMLILVVAATACHKEGNPNSSGLAGYERKSYALTAIEIDRVLGFESPTSDWTVIQNGSGTVSASTSASQGSRALALMSRGYVTIESALLTSLGSRVANVIHYDILPPSELARVSPYYYGATQLFLDLPSLGLNNVYLGQVDIMSLPLGQWSTWLHTTVRYHDQAPRQLRRPSRENRSQRS